MNIHACVSYWYQLKSLWKEELTDFNKSPVICRSIQGKHRRSYSQMNDWSLFLVWKTVCLDAPPTHPLSVESNLSGSIQGSTTSKVSLITVSWMKSLKHLFFGVNLLIFSFSPLMYHYKNTPSAALQRFVVVLSGKQRRFFLKVILRYWTCLPLELLPLSLLKQHGHDTQKNKSPSTNGALTGLDALS